MVFGLGLGLVVRVGLVRVGVRVRVRCTRQTESSPDDPSDDSIGQAVCCYVRSILQGGRVQDTGRASTCTVSVHPVGCTSTASTVYRHRVPAPITYSVGTEGLLTQSNIILGPRT